MDESVLKAIDRWPNVPAVYGWLSLDRRGQWRLRGETLGNPALRTFIDRNYACDDRGCWYFQNGPQRVFVQLEYTPWVYRLEPDSQLLTHTGVSAGPPCQVFMDDHGAVLIETVLGIGLLDDRDLTLFSASLGTTENANPGDAVIEERLSNQIGGSESGLCFYADPDCLPLQSIRHAQVAKQFEFLPDPQTTPTPPPPYSPFPIQKA